jgi:hypothetical protein
MYSGKIAVPPAPGGGGLKKNYSIISIVFKFLPANFILTKRKFCVNLSVAIS